MRDVVIRAEDLGKSYIIGHRSKGERYTALRDVLTQAVKGYARSFGDMARGRQLVDGNQVEEFWALRNVNFEVRRGDIVGVIGRNGAGKSTLLKILSRITEPSSGRVSIKGRIASLLEVGTGFHPELTGRENVYLNSAILGMSRRETRRKFDEIVDFAGVEKFIDTPVKRYSSGMYVRLAFAVAAHLEPEILVIDEVLAVGDAEFQKKCLGKMTEVAKNGRTVLFVSHNLSAVRQLCSHGIYLSGGTSEFVGNATDALAKYMLGLHEETTHFRRAITPQSRAFVKEAKAYVSSSNEDSSRAILTIVVVVETTQQTELNLDFRLKNASHEPVAVASTSGFGNSPLIKQTEGRTEYEFKIDFTQFAVGQYFLSIDITVPWVEYIDRCEDCIAFDKGDGHWVQGASPLMQSYGLGALLVEFDSYESRIAK